MTEQQLDLQFVPYPQDFLLFIANNPKLWDTFEREANRIWHRGFRHYSAYTIVEYMRHETALYEKDSDFKINNNWRPWLARYYQEKYPDRSGLFEIRRIRKGD
jgi:hypothetical protein